MPTETRTGSAEGPSTGEIVDALKALAAVVSCGGTIPKELSEAVMEAADGGLEEEA